MGFGSRLFRAARRDLADNGLHSVLVWALSDNQRAIDFYRRLGAEPIRRASEYFGDEKLGRIALGFGPLGS
jgi:ribosomal protein S18 acetylase RimI-like enzyme